MKSKINRLINTEEYVLINGINQYLYHRGNNYNNPVLLFLHGGPGSAESIFAHAFQEKWEETYLIPEAGHMTMIDQPASFFDALIEINNKEA